MYGEIVCLGLPLLIVFRKMCDELGMHLGRHYTVFSKLGLFFPSSIGFLEVKGGSGGIAEQIVG